MSGIDRSSSFAEAHPIGKSSADNNQHKVMNDDTRNTQKEALGNFIDVIKAPFDFVNWFKNNWQLGLIGLICVLILLKE